MNSKTNSNKKYIFLSVVIVLAAVAAVSLLGQNAFAQYTAISNIGGGSSPIHFNLPLLPAKKSWQVEVYNSIYSTKTKGTTPMLNLTPKASGAYSYKAVPPAGYLIPNSEGNLTYTGSPLSITLGLGVLNCSLNCKPGDIALDGLFVPRGKKWTATISNAVTSQTRSSNIVRNGSSTINFTEGYGTYNITLAQNAIPGYGSSWISNEVNFTNGTFTNTTVVFSKCPNYPANCTSPRYLVIFQNSGLPTGTKWAINMNGKTVTSNSPYANFSETTGTYLFKVGSVPGYKPEFNEAYITIGAGPLWTCVLIPFSPTNGTVSSLAAGAVPQIKEVNSLSGALPSSTLCYPT